MRGVPAGAAGDLLGAPRASIGTPRMRGGARDDARQVVDGVVARAGATMPKRSRSGAVSMPARVVAPTSVNARQVEAQRARAGP